LLKEFGSANSIVIAVFCYNRLAKLKVAMGALLKNPECMSMEIIFFSDGYKNEHDRKKVIEMRAYIDTITGFKQAHKHFREKNENIEGNFKMGLTYLCNNYEKFIVIEDDIVVTPNYIKYLLDALVFYENEKSVFCITGFCFPLYKKNYPYDTLVFNRFSSYGWASWSDRVKNVIWDKNELKKLMQTSVGFRKRLNTEGYDLCRMLRKQLSGKISTWDIQMCVYALENRLKIIYPIISKTLNIGFDNESTNTFGVNFLETPQDEGYKRDFKFCDVNTIVPQFQSQLRKPFKLPALIKRKIINTLIKFAS
jgi:hypothetical protein